MNYWSYFLLQLCVSKKHGTAQILRSHFGQYVFGFDSQFTHLRAFVLINLCSVAKKKVIVSRHIVISTIFCLYHYLWNSDNFINLLYSETIFALNWPIYSFHRRCPEKWTLVKKEAFLFFHPRRQGVKAPFIKEIFLFEAISCFHLFSFRQTHYLLTLVIYWIKWLYA